MVRTPYIRLSLLLRDCSAMLNVNKTHKVVTSSCKPGRDANSIDPPSRPMSGSQPMPWRSLFDVLHVKVLMMHWHSRCMDLMKMKMQEDAGSWEHDLPFSRGS